MTHPSSAAQVLMYRARAVLAQGYAAPALEDRFTSAQLAALRAAAAVLAERAHPSQTRRRLVSVWDLLRRLAPEYEEWAALFAAAAPLRAAVDAGGGRGLSARGADDHLRAAEEFLRLVEARLGAPRSVPRASLAS